MSATFSTAPVASSSSMTIEVQQSIATPVSVPTHSARTESPSSRWSRESDAMDLGSFGYNSMFSRPHDSRHDDRRQSLADVPPAYDEEAAIPLPEYTLHAPEPVTLAMYLFKFGFLFPLFWFFGAFILLSPLREPPTSSDSAPSWMPEKTEEERQRIIADIREVELKWARRCLYAFLTFAVLATAGSVTAYMVTRH